MKRANRSAHVFLSFALVLVAPLAAIAQTAVPVLISHQGELRSPTTGQPVPDGWYDMVFKIYGVRSRGTALWEGTHSTANGNPVQVTNGVFSTILGSGTGNALDASLFDGAAMWLETVIGTETLSPRQQISIAAAPDINPGTIPESRIDPLITRDAEMDAAITAHAAISDAHHTRYTDAEAVAAMGAKSPNNPLNHDKTSSFSELTDVAADAQIPASIARDSEIMPMVLANDGIGSGLDADTLDGMDAAALEESAEIDSDIAAHTAVPDAHHARYTDAEAVAAMGPRADTNPLNHDKTTSLPWGSITSIPAGFADGIDNDSDIASWFLTGNAGTSASNFLGTIDNQALELRVENARALRLEPNATSPNLIAGHGENIALTGVVGAAIGGGGQAGSPNRVTDSHGTIGGGLLNQAGDDAGNSEDASCATVGGGVGNTASSGFATVAGGRGNTASGKTATVGGGAGNSASSSTATVGGGSGNTASGKTATVGGGSKNWATADYATIAGGGPSNPTDPSQQGNLVTDDYGTISGGGHNTAGDNFGTTQDCRFATVGGGNDNTASGTDSTVSGGGSNVASGTHATVGGGGLNIASSNAATVAGGRDNTASGQSATVGGGTMNVASFGAATVGGGASNTASGEAATVGGGGGNTANGELATVSGGEFNVAIASHATVAGGEENSASGEHATVSGGSSNSASSYFATVAGGSYNTASLAHATVGGGFLNTASADYATVGGGQENTASASRATVGGGAWNTASAGYATVGGGQENTAGTGYATVGGGWHNLANGYVATVGGGEKNEAPGEHGTVGGGAWNTASADYATVGGGVSNHASHPCATVGGGSGNHASYSYATVGGGAGNSASSSTATVGGGSGNTASADYATVGGGAENTASGCSATVAGGWVNIASEYMSAVGGGAWNTASGNSATVGGGNGNTASGYVATVGGGQDNTASGWQATVPGGYDNTALGACSYAAGEAARAEHGGAFVWSHLRRNDWQPFYFHSTAANQFSVRCEGGARFVSGFSDYPDEHQNFQEYGVYLAPGAGSWETISDRALKENVTAVDGKRVLDRLMAMPMAEWNYKAQDASIRHMGPMAQDFYAAFGLGEDNKRISTVDADGVALAAIQGLHEIVKEKDEKIATLEARIEALEGLVEKLVESQAGGEE